MISRSLAPRRVLAYFTHRWNQRVKLEPGYHAQLVKLFTLLAPQQARGMRKMRVGADRDGGYVMLDDFEKIGAAVSLGIGPDVSWDRAMAEKGIPVWQFDHTVATTPEQHPLFHFEPKRVVSEPTSPQDVAFGDLLQRQTGKQFVVKMDIEGDEWNVLRLLPLGRLGGCRQIVVELHNFLSVVDSEWRDHAMQTLLVLNKEFAVVHIHGNNLAKHIVTGDLDLPDALEITFANRNFYEFEPTLENFPGPEDRKNNPYFPDFRLGRFQFQADGTKV